MLWIFVRYVFTGATLPWYQRPVVNYVVAPVWVDYEPVGVKFYQHVYSMVHGLSLQDQQAADEATIDDEESSDSEEDEGINPLLLDPIQWKVRALLINCTGECRERRIMNASACVSRTKIITPSWVWGRFVIEHHQRRSERHVSMTGCMHHGNLSACCRLSWALFSLVAWRRPAESFAAPS